MNPNENPFESTTSLTDGDNPFADPTPKQPTFPPNVQGGVGGMNAEGAARMEELARRERELEARERDLAREQARIRSGGKANWPFWPFLYHDIAVEIPAESQALIKRLYLLWLILLGTLVINFVACIFILLSGTADGGKDLGASIMYMFVIGIASFFLWYRPIYFGYANEKSLYYYFYFFFCGFHLLFSVYMIIGIPSTGSAGLIQTISAYARHYIVAGILGTIASVGWIMQGLGNMYYYRLIWRHGNEAGHTFNKAKGELTRYGARAYFSGTVGV